jgi:hypothetical protein
MVVVSSARRLRNLAFGDQGLFVVSWDIADSSLTERYFELLKSAKVKGYLFQQQNYNDIPKSDA